ncbi:hypothetical protein L2D08_22845 [Domibacillus sp. PGB-M46]|uniref:molybdopterin dinucleotide binding domain-containing protein n=1 Tax=Domibacillus sp. PGB-M46 TaxID=2910255 RepID=UPI001F590D41|nr:molybdopterin dinucleotide binding domain-containing protein [Domibacillus sp. PGB-M46]MCI2257157.1 hypothetical protein [Domibacillus sp. PGB-M46]
MADNWAACLALAYTNENGTFPLSAYGYSAWNVEIHTEDAQKHPLIPGELVHLFSPSGWMEVSVRMGDALQPGLAFIPFHFADEKKKPPMN